MDEMMNRYWAVVSVQGGGRGRRYTDEARELALRLWRRLIDEDGSSEALAARAVGVDVRTLRRWWRQAAGPVAMAPVVVSAPVAQQRSVVGAVSDQGTGTGRVALESPDGWRVMVESVEEAVALLRGLR